MKIIHGGGFSDEELADVRPDVYRWFLDWSTHKPVHHARNYQNIHLRCFRNLTDAMEILIHWSERWLFCWSTANLGVLLRFNDDNSHYPCRLGLSLEESLEDVKVCQSSEAPMPSKLAAIRFFSSWHQKNEIIYLLTQQKMFLKLAAMGFSSDVLNYMPC